ncbi:MAG: alpha/beta fold hydrolase [Rhizobiales bacterium]|nr:alpha/beta hydrolase [Hyphomicrobiales bacterium]NRB15188.1 alpha/beta fold hydrolase [Hyphomicrobiales bacterium]
MQTSRAPTGAPTVCVFSKSTTSSIAEPPAQTSHLQTPSKSNQTCAPNLYEYGDNIEQWAENALTQTKSKKLIVVGCSVGGSCALEVAKQAPDRIAALVLIGTNANHNPNRQNHRKYVDFADNHGVQAAWRHYWEPLLIKDNNKEAALEAERIALRQSVEHLTNGLKAFHLRPNLIDIVAEANFPIHVVMTVKRHYRCVYLVGKLALLPTLWKFAFIRSA